MMTRAWHSGPGPARILYAVTLLGVALISIVGRGGTETVTALVASESAADRAAFSRDFDEIHAGGTLRVLMANSSSSYYVLRGAEYGFEYELARQIARELDLHLRVVLPDAVLTPVEMLQSGQVDVIAMPMFPEARQAEDLALTVPYNSVQQRLVVHRDQADLVQRLRDMDGLQIVARRFGSGERELSRLRRMGVDLIAVLYGPDVPQEQILDLVADGTYPAAIALDVEVEAARRFREELQESVALGPSKDVRWAVRSTSPQLLAALNSVLTRHVRRGEDGHIVASKFYNVVRARYFENASRFERHLSDPFRFGRTGRVSPYDDLFRQAARDTGLDWRLLAALSFQESRFDPTAVSWAGAHGLMQLLPSTAGVSARALHDPDVNVPLGARHLRMLFDLYEDVPEPERLRFALAAYNCGQGHLDDARRLSSLLGKDPDVWEGSVRESLLLLRQPNFHRMVRYGYVRGNETVAYVREVERRFELLMAVSNRSSSARLVSAVEDSPNHTDTPDMTAGARGLN